MRRKAEKDKTNTLFRTGDIKRDFTDQQLAAIGAAALAFNALEDQLEALFCAATQIPVWLSAEVSSRINGLEGTVEIVQVALRDAQQWNKDNSVIVADLKNLSVTLSQFAEMKRIRDAIMHARIINSAAAIARGANRRGKPPYEVWLSVEALSAYYGHANAICETLKSGAALLSAVNLFGSLQAGNPYKEKCAQLLQSRSTLFRHFLQVQRSLLPMPKFPSEAEIQQVVDLWFAAQQAELRDWMRPFQRPGKRVRIEIDPDAGSVSIQREPPPAARRPK